MSVNDGWQSEPTDGSKSGWRQRSVVVVVIVVAIYGNCSRSGSCSAMKCSVVVMVLSGVVVVVVVTF